MNDLEIRHGFWDLPRELKSEPKPITYIEDYVPTKYLSLDFNSLYPASKQNNIISQWCKLLPELKEVKYIWLINRVNQKTFDSICQMENIEGIWIQWSVIKSIENIRQLNRLNHLHLGSSPKIESIDPLGSMSSLITLELEQLNKISNFSILANLVNIEGLGVNGSLWTTQKIDTLEFLKPLINLKYLTLINSRLKDTSFDPILNLKELVRFRASWNHSINEFKKLNVLPKLKIGFENKSWEDVIAARENKR